jgi:hypothetical protein
VPVRYAASLQRLQVIKRRFRRFQSAQRDFLGQPISAQNQIRVHAARNPGNGEIAGTGLDR